MGTIVIDVKKNCNDHLLWMYEPLTNLTYLIQPWDFKDYVSLLQ